MHLRVPGARWLLLRVQLGGLLNSTRKLSFGGGAYHSLQRAGCTASFFEHAEDHTSDRPRSQRGHHPTFRKETVIESTPPCQRPVLLVRVHQYAMSPYHFPSAEMDGIS